MKVNQERLVSTFLDLVKIEGKSKEERKVADYVKQQLHQIGLAGIEDNTGSKITGNCGNLICHLPATTKDLPSWLLLVHLDTVVPCAGVKPVIKESVIYSSGDTILGADDRSGVSILIELAQGIIERKIPHNDLWLVFTVAEEVGLLGSTHLNYKEIKVDYGLVLDSTGEPGRITVRQPSSKTIDATFFGKAAHAGVCPEKGINAIQMAAWAISQIPLGRLDEETTATIGLISGGQARNIVPERAEIKGGARSHNPEKLENQISIMKTLNVVAASANSLSIKIPSSILIIFQRSTKFKTIRTLCNIAID